MKHLLKSTCSRNKNKELLPTTMRLDELRAKEREIDR